MAVVSDFRGPRDWRTPLLQLASRHAVVAVEITDPREQELPNVGHLWLVDPETGASRPLEDGASIVVNDLDDEPAQETIALVEKAGGRAVACNGRARSATTR